MPVTNDQVRDQMGASTASASDADVTAAIDVAAALVDQYAGDQKDDIPPAIYDRCVLLVAVEQLHQDNAPNGVLNQTFDLGVGDQTSTPVRIGRDPLKPAYPLLTRWVAPEGFA